MTDWQLWKQEQQPVTVYPERIRVMWNAYGKRENSTCKKCTHLQRVRYHDKRYLKCDLTVQTNGPGTDWRAGWIACGRYEEASE